MIKKLADRLKSSCSVIKFEIYALFCSLVGIVKSRVFFRQYNVNKLEIGVGNTARKNGFITSDINLKSDFPFDLRIGLPFPDDSIDIIYAEHVLEHFDYKDLLILLKDCHRALKPTGIMSIVVPNAKIYLTAYFKPEEFEYKKYCLYDFGLSYKHNIDYVNYMFYMGGHHRYMFDEDSILTLLKDEGFKNVHKRDFDDNLDQQDRKYESIYVEATK
ncbi:MAG: methyltransferase domain-containing protein [Thermodesulfovibrionales bacterium]